MLSSEVRERIRRRLGLLYADRTDACLEQLLAEDGRISVTSRERLWDERDVVLITYADQVRSADATPLATLANWLTENGLQELINSVHLLPFFPYSSDDGFSVIDYEQVDPQVGTWQDVAALEESFDLMFDLVLNHCSREHCWFRKYLSGRPPFDRYFIEAAPTADLSQVTRPRSTPLLTPFDTDRGTKHVWTTFSDDQVDLNYAEPDVLLAMLNILLDYVRRGARIIRLDAIAYLWKQLGTSCIHLPQTHELVKLMRDVLDAVAPGTLLLTETNVPHAENVSYFGDGDEAHLIYQFSLPPLLLDACLSGDATAFSRWLAGVSETRPGTSFLNFTASHDGIGVRPLDGLVPNERMNAVVEAVRKRQGLVSTRRRPDGSDAPYELNITYFSAVGDPGRLNDAEHVRRFLTTQAVMLALKGIPAVYFHSLVGTPNDLQGVQQTGRARSINRRKFDRAELDTILADVHAPQRLVFDGYRRLLETRIAQAAFHPDAPQAVWPTNHPAVAAFLRTSLDGSQRILVAANFNSQPQALNLSAADGPPFQTDLLTGRAVPPTQEVVLEPYSVVWLEAGNVTE